MNLIEFLTIIDGKVSGLNQAKLQRIIHEIARTLPDDKRVWFIKTVDSVVKEDVPEDEIREAVSLTAKELFKTRDRLLKNLKKIDDGTYTITEEYNENYSHWDPWGDYEEFSYNPSDYIVKVVKECEELILDFLDIEHYEDALDFLDDLSSVDFMVDSDYGDGMILDYFELVDYGVDTAENSDLALPLIYAVYKSKPSSEWMEKIYSLIKKFVYDDFSFEDLFSYAEELPNQDQFLDLAIEYFGTQTGDIAYRLLWEALDLKGNYDLALRKAQEFSKFHPKLYLSILENAAINDEQIIAIAQEALEKIDQNIALRTSIAFWLASAAIDAQKTEVADEGLYEAFLAQKTPSNYLRALYYSNDTQKMKESLSKVINGEITTKSYYNVVELLPYYPSNTDLAYLKLLDGQFDQIYTDVLNPNYYLGWRGKGIKEILSLFLTILYKDGSKSLPYEIEHFSKDVFHLDDDKYGIEVLRNDDSEKIVQEFLEKWKSDLPEIDRDEAIKMIEHFKDLIEKRTEAIMAKGRTNYYGECAAFIVAIGMVEESLGKEGAMMKLVNKYRAQYSRRRNLISAFKNLLGER